MTSADPAADPQPQVQALLEQIVAEGGTRGIQVAAYHRGRLVVDAVAGHLDLDGRRSVTSDSVFPVFSCGKGVVATAFGLAMQEGLVEADQRLAEVWPDFAGDGRDAITMRQVMGHTAGMWALPEAESRGYLTDWDEACRRIAAMPPATEPGRTMRYHAVSYGHLVGLAVQQVRGGKPFGELVRRQIAEPLGVADQLCFGVADGKSDRIAELDRAKPFEPPEEEDRAIPRYLQPLESMMNDPAMRQSCIPGAGMLASAHGLARHYAALLPGGVDGVELFNDATRAAMTQWTGPADPEQRAELEMFFAMGYQVRGPQERRGVVFGHGGYGGSDGHADLDRRLAVGFTLNTMQAEPDLRERVLGQLQQLFPVEG